MIRVACLGRSTADAKTNDPVEGKKKFTALTLVTDVYTGTGPDGAPKYEGVFLKCVGFDRTAEALAKVVKGEKVWVWGELSLDSFKKEDGVVLTSLKCVVREWERVIVPTEGAKTAAPAATEEDAPASSGDEDPFN
jgi:single-stranded DNA-binding protein